MKDISRSQFLTARRLEKIRSVLEKRQPGLTIVAENINDPHNLSAVIRSCDAVGAMEVCTVYNGAQPFPKLGKASSASAKKWVPLKQYRTVKECYDELHSEGKKIYTTKMDEPSVSLYELDLVQPVALVFGNEHAGVSKEAYSIADGNFLIPQVGMIQSLNISVACAVCLFEAFRQRLKAGLYGLPQLPQEILEQKIEEWAGKR